MTKSAAMKPERRVQPKFSIGRAAAALALVAAIGLFDRWLATIPDRHELGWRVARITAAPVIFDAEAFAPFRLAGAWRLSDSGILVRFNQARTAAQIGELPGGPQSPGFKFNRDSEALVADPRGRGWWVSFENRDELWLYDRRFARALQRLSLGDRDWPENNGIEGLAADGESLLLFHEAGGTLIRVTGERARLMRIVGAGARLSDAIDLGGGQWLVVERRPTPLGFRNALVLLERAGGGYRLGRRYRLLVGPLDNVEAIAVEPLPDGARRLWLMTDDNQQPPQRTLLIALDLPQSFPGQSVAKN
jgi:hypothetical protein